MVFYLSNPSAKLKQLDGRKETVYWNFEGEKWQIILWMCVDKRRDTEWKRFQLFRNLLIFVTIFHEFFLQSYRLKILSLRWGLMLNLELLFKRSKMTISFLGSKMESQAAYHWFYGTSSETPALPYNHI